jgi:lipoprotein NlpI
MGRCDDALTSFQKALELRPGVPDTHHSIGLTHLKLGNAVAALEQCELLRVLDSSKERDLREQITQSKLS